MGATRYFEQFNIGDTEITRSRKIDIADVKLFGACTNLNDRIYSDELYCKKNLRINKIVVPYALAMNVVDSFFAESVSPDGVATLHYGYDNVRFYKFIYPGESIYAVFTVTGLEVKNDEFGVLILEAKTYNQDDELVMSHTDKLYVERLKK